MAIKNHTISTIVYLKENKIPAIEITEAQKSLDAQVSAFLEKMHFSQVRDIIAQTTSDPRSDGVVLSRTIVYTTEAVAPGFEPKALPK